MDKNIEFTTKLTAKDMFAFNIRHTYTHFQGISTIIFGIVLIALAIYNRSGMSTTYFFLYIIIAILFMTYVPLTLYTRAVNRMKSDTALSNPLKYQLTDDGIVVTSEAADDSATLPWDYVFKVVTTKKYLLIYSNRVNAYIIPKASVASIYPQLKEEFEQRVESYRLEMKKIW